MLNATRTNRPLLLTNIGQLVTPPPGTAVRGAAMRQLQVTEDAAVLVGTRGKILACGKRREVMRSPYAETLRSELREIDCKHRVLLPGFVDSHTHPIFATPRLVDFEKRTAGASYEEIAAAGGGIRSSVQAVRSAPLEALVDRFSTILLEMTAHGTTTVEAKSGYGLSREAEIKSLEAIQQVAEKWPGTVVATYLGAHVVPKEFAQNPDAYVSEICDTTLPAIAQQKLARFADVFIEPSAFTLAQALRIFKSAKHHGMQIRAHIGQLTHTPLHEILALAPASLDHLDNLTAHDITQLAATDTVATLVPSANHFLGLRSYPDARKLIEAGAIVALASDFNPGTAPSLNMQLAMHLACTQMKMSPEEAITASTVNGAASLGLSGQKGSIAPEKDADLALFDVQDYREIAYWFGSNHCMMTVAQGNVVHHRKPRWF